MSWGLTGNGFVYGTIESRKWELRKVVGLVDFASGTEKRSDVGERETGWTRLCLRNGRLPFWE